MFDYDQDFVTTLVDDSLARGEQAGRTVIDCLAKTRTETGELVFLGFDGYWRNMHGQKPAGWPREVSGVPYGRHDSGETNHEPMLGRHRSGGVSCWYYACLHVRHDETGQPILMPDNHSECGMWTTTMPELFALKGPVTT